MLSTVLKMCVDKLIKVNSTFYLLTIC